MSLQGDQKTSERIILETFDDMPGRLFCPFISDDIASDFKLLFDRMLPELLGYDSKEQFCKKYVSDDGLALSAMKRLFQLSVSEKQFFQWVAENEPVERNVRASYNQHHPLSSFDMSSPFCNFFVMTQFFPIFTKLTRQFIARCYCEKRFYALIKKLLIEQFSIDRSEEALTHTAVLFGYNSAFNEYAGCSKKSSDLDIKCVVCVDDPQVDEIISAVGQVFELMNHEFSREYGGVTFEGYVFSEVEVLRFYQLDYSEAYLPPHTHLRSGAQLDSSSLLFSPANIKKFHVDPPGARLMHDCQCYALSIFPGNFSRILGDERIFEAIMSGSNNFKMVDFIGLVLGQLLSPWASKRDTPGAIVLGSGSDSEHSSPTLPRRETLRRTAHRSGSRVSSGSGSEESFPKPRVLDGDSDSSGDDKASASRSGVCFSFRRKKTTGEANVRLPKTALFRLRFDPQSSPFSFNIKALLRVNDAANCMHAFVRSALSFSLRMECHFLSKFALILRNLKEELSGFGLLDCAEANLLNSLDFQYIYHKPALLSQFMRILAAMLNQSFIPEDVADSIRASFCADQSFAVFQQAVSVFFYELDKRVANISTQIQRAIAGIIIPWSFEYAQQVQVPRWEKERERQLEQEVIFRWWETP